MQTNTRASQIRPAGNIPIRRPEAKLFLFWSRSKDAGDMTRNVKLFKRKRKYENA